MTRAMIPESTSLVLPKSSDFNPRAQCWNCRDRPRCIVFLPKDRGSYLSCKCEVCTRAPAVLAKLANEETASQ